MGTLRQGAHNLFKTCINLQPSEHSLVITDENSYEIGLEIYNAAEKISGTSGGVEMYLLEEFGTRPLTKLPKRIAERIPSANVAVWAAKSQEGELPMRKQFRELAVKYAREAHMPGINKQMMEQGMCADYNEVFKLSNHVYEVVKDARVAEVLSPTGTKLRVELDPKLRWKISHGLLKDKGEWGNEPDGEDFTCPGRVDGTLVAEELGDWIGEKYGTLTPPEGKYNTPVYLEVQNSRVNLGTIRTKNKKLKIDLIKYLQTDENSDRAGEFALPTNKKVMKLPLIGDLLQDEKARVHLAFGHPYPEETGADWESASHIDCIIKNATVVLKPGNIKLLKNNVYLI
jgi:hypothetical protein